MSDACLAPQGTKRLQPVIDFCIPSQGLKGSASPSSTLNSKVINFTKAAGTGTQDITGFGFTPKFYYLITNGNTAANTVATHAVFCLGFSDGTNSHCVSNTSQDGVTDTKARRFADSNSVVNIRNIGSPASATCVGDHSAFLADGVRINWTAGSINPEFSIVAFGGDITVDITTHTTPTATGVQSYATSMDTADMVMLISAATTPEDTVKEDASISIGFGTATDQGVTAVGADDAVSTSNTHRYQRTNNIFASIVESAGTIEEEAALDAITSTGFDLDFTTADGTARDFYAISFKGGQWQVGSGTTPTTATTKAFATSFEPKFLALVSRNSGVATTVAADTYLHMGWSDGTTEACVAIHDNDLVATSDAARQIRDDMCFWCFNNTVSSLEEGTVDSFNPTDFTINMTKAHASAREFIWFVCGDG